MLRRACPRRSGFGDGGKQGDPDTYAPTEAFSTRPGARVIRYDADRRQLYIMANAGTFDASKTNPARFNPWRVNVIFPDSLSLLSCGRGPAPK